jgi:hypothetical protein
MLNVERKMLNVFFKINNFETGTNELMITGIIFLKFSFDFKIIIILFYNKVILSLNEIIFKFTESLL